MFYFSSIASNLHFFVSDEHCEIDVENQHTCVEFSFTQKISSVDIEDAELWAYPHQPEQSTTHNKTLHLKDVRYPLKDTFLTSKNVPNAEGWIKFNVNVGQTVKRWLHNPHNDRPHVIDIVSADCSTDCHESSIALAGSNKPYLMITLKASEHHRGKRDVSRCSNSTGGCCLQEWEVNLRDYPQFNFILAPATFQTNYCKGACQGECKFMAPGKSTNV